MNGTQLTNETQVNSTVATTDAPTIKTSSLEFEIQVAELPIESNSNFTLGSFDNVLLGENKSIKAIETSTTKLQVDQNSINLADIFNKVFNDPGQFFLVVHDDSTNDTEKLLPLSIQFEALPVSKINISSTKVSSNSSAIGN